METNKVQTAKEFIKGCEYDGSYIPVNEVLRLMKGFAELHVKAALREALDSIPCLGSSTDIPTNEEVEKEVLNAYPKELIQ